MRQEWKEWERDSLARRKVVRFQLLDANQDAQVKVT